jgi:predicted 3-demethylubiquinone-9 3-methyltransferase (glyoxalase superfamily)
VRQSEDLFDRWGPPSLMFAKFVPGFAAIATSMAGVGRRAFEAMMQMKKIDVAAKEAARRGS